MLSMPNWTAEIALAWLVVASLAVGGWLGLWVATSSRHWFTRTMVASGVLAPLLWRPVYEPFVTLLVELVVVVIGVTVYRRNWPQWRFSIAGLLMLTVPVALLAVAAMRSGELIWLQWLDAIMFGLLAGALVLFAAWCAVGKLSLRIKLVSSIFVLPSGAVAWAWLNYIDNGMSQYGDVGWPPINAIGWPAAWASLQVVLFCSLMVIGVIVVRHGERHQLQRRSFMGWVGIMAMVAAYPAYVLWQLSTPVPVPSAAPVASSAIESLQQLAGDPAFAPIFALANGNSVDWVAMRKAVSDAQPQYDQMRALTDQPLTIPVDYSDAAILSNQDVLGALRQVARLWSYASTAAQRAGDADEAYAASATLLAMSHQLEGQGFLTDALVISSFESMALADIYQARLLFDPRQEEQLAQLLLRYNAQRPCLGELRHRDRIQSENIYSWHGHFYDLMDCAFTQLRSPSDAEFRWVIQGQNAAISALLSAELALEAYRSETNTYPETLSALVPDYLPEVPADPCSAEGESIVYRRNGGGYHLYSRGFDGDDDGGRPFPARQDFWTIPSAEDGDLTLERCFSKDNE